MVALGRDGGVGTGEDTTDYQVWVNGEWVRSTEAGISLRDRGFRAGDAVFDTSRTFNGKVFRLHDHLVRLSRSLKYVRIDPGLTLQQMEELSQKVLEANESLRPPGGDLMVTQIVTRGEADLMARRAKSLRKPTVCVWLEPIDFASYADAYVSGGRLVVVKMSSHLPSQIDPRVKHYSRLHFVLADLQASDVDPGAMPVLTDVWGNITESIVANIFAVIEGRLVTPPRGLVLEGISRKTTLELAETMGLSCQERPLQAYDLYRADEVFLTSTPYCIMPVGHVDGRQIEDSPAGRITEKLLEAWSELVGLDIRAQILEQGGVKTSKQFTT